MKTLIIYKSKTGFTKKYAQWLSESLSADIVEFSNVTKESYVNYELIIFGGGLYVLGINGLKKILKDFTYYKNKRLIVFATGATPNREETTNEIRNVNFTPGQQQDIKFFYLRGGFDFSKLGIIDKLLMILLKIKLKMKKESKRSPDEKGMLAAYEQVSDFSKQKYIEEVVDYIKTITK